MLDKQQFTVLLYGLGKLIRLAAKRYPEFYEKLSEKDLVAQFKIRDNSQGRAFTFLKGKVTSQTGIHPQADVVLSFEDAATALRMLKPGGDMLDFISASKAFQVEAQGDDEAVIWLLETLNMMLHLNVDFGIDVGNGVRLYTNNGYWPHPCKILR